MIKHILSIFAAPTGFGSAGIRRQNVCGAITIVGASLTSAQWGVETEETTAAINCENFEVRYYLEVNEKLPGIKGETRGRARSTVPSREITVSGEITGALTMWVFATAITGLANDVADLGSATGGIYLDEGTIPQTRSGWRRIDAKLSSDPGCA